MADPKGVGTRLGPNSFITVCKQSLGQGNVLNSVCQEFCPGGACVVGGHAW